MNGITGWWVGVDVSKSKLDVAVLDERGKVKSHVFDNGAKGFEAQIADFPHDIARWNRENSHS